MGTANDGGEHESLSGTVINARYAVLDVIGRGGSGTVYKARDLQNKGRYVAIKVLLPRFSDNPAFQSMLHREGGLTGLLQHPAIVPTIDFGEAFGRSYLVMEYIPGRPLTGILAARKTLEVPEAVCIARSVGEALSYAHGLGVIHLDVKPSNILVAEDGRVLLTDFGIARAGGLSDMELGVGAVAGGTRIYMAPEQDAGKPLDERSDVYSLGVVLSRSLGGIGTHVPEPLRNVIVKATEPERTRRFRNMNEFLSALGDAVQIPDQLRVPSLLSRAVESSDAGEQTSLHAAEGVGTQRPVPALYALSRRAAESVAHQPATPPPQSAGASPEAPVPPASESPPGQFIQIRFPSGQQRVIELKGDRLTLGRSASCGISVPEDAGLSRQHLAFEREASQWFVLDLGSKNGTLLNDIPVKCRTRLNAGDRIFAGHLSIIFADSSRDGTGGPGVVFVDPGNDSPSTHFTINLDRALSENIAQPASSARVQALIRAGQELSSHRPLEELFPMILDLAIEAVGAQRGLLITLDNDSAVVQAQRGGGGFRISTSVRDKVLRENASVLVTDPQFDEAFRERLSVVEQRVRTLMAVPLQTKDRTIGLIYVDSPSLTREFTRDDLNMLTVMANVAAIRIEHGRLAEIEQAERILARELEQAADIQKRLLPAAAPRVPGLDLAGYHAACRTVGGDYYDFFDYGNGRVGLVIADVSGKGMPAAMLMMSLQARAQLLSNEPEDLGELISRLNTQIVANIAGNRFITLFACILDAGSGELVYCNAGHNPPFIIRAGGEVQMLPNSGPVMGILASFTYSRQTERLDPGDQLVLYSDGVTEACDASGEEFGEDNLTRVIQANRGKSAEEIIAAITQAAQHWVQGIPAADDITLVVARRQPTR